MEKQSSRIRGEILILILILSCSTIMLFFHLGLAPLNKAEGRIAEVVREMAISGDYFHPTCLWKPYVTKPLIPYWLAISFHKLRPALDELTLRFPSALFAAMAILSTFLLGKKLFSVKIALFSCIILSTSYGVITWSRCAAADMLNMSAIIIAVTYYWMYRDKPSLRNAFLLGILIALAGQMKGLVGIVIPIMLILLDLILSKRLRHILFSKPTLAFMLGLLFYFLPTLLSALSGTHAHSYNWLYMAFHESVTRAIRPFDHKGSPFTYIEFVPIWLLPWSIILLGMLGYYILYFKKLTYPAKWLLIGFCSIFLLFTLAGSRRSYYILPILPFAALIAGSSLEFEPGGHKFLKFIAKTQCLLFFIVSILLLASPPLAQHFRIPLPSNFFHMLLVEGLVLMPFSVYPLLRTSSHAAPSSLPIVALCTAAFVISSGFLLFEKPFFDRQATEKPFALRVKRYISAHSLQPGTFSYFKLGPRTRARLSFYMNFPFPIKNLESPSEIKNLLPSSKPMYLIVEQRWQKRIKNYLGSVLEGDVAVKTLFLQKLHGYEGWPNHTGRYKKDRLCLVHLQRN